MPVCWQVEAHMFSLTRFFSITSLVAFIAVTLALTLFYRQAAVADLIALRQENNVALTQTFANSLWPEFAEFVAGASEFSAAELQAHPQTALLHAAVLDQMRGLSVIKVKVYDLNGLTVYSSEYAQIGQDKSDNAGYVSARSGTVATELTHRDTFSAFEQVIEDRDVISSYIPIRRGPGGPVEGVFEVYDDVTALLDRIEQTEREIVAVVVGVLAVLYAALFFIVRHGDAMIRQQTAERLRAERSRLESEDRLRTVINSAPVMLWAVDKDKKVTLLEGRGLPNWGLAADGAVGRKISEIPGMVPEIERDIDRALAGKEQVSVTEINDFVFDMRYMPVRGQNGDIVGVLGVATDITERTLAEGALGEAHQNLEARNKQLERVHEFLNTTLEMMEDSIQRGSTQGEIMAYLSQARTQFKKLA